MIKFMCAFTKICPFLYLNFLCFTWSVLPPSWNITSAGVWEKVKFWSVFWRKFKLLLAFLGWKLWSSGHFFSLTLETFSPCVVLNLCSLSLSIIFMRRQHLMYSVPRMECPEYCYKILSLIGHRVHELSWLNGPHLSGKDEMSTKKYLWDEMYH